jgi:hypothetical protein
LRAVTATRSPRFKSMSANTRPKPVEDPVMNQTRELSLSEAMSHQ